MAGIHDAILENVRAHFQSKFVDDATLDDLYRAGYVGVGQLQGDPVDPDEARISITLHENDPDTFAELGPRGFGGSWHDEEDFDNAEIGASTYIRRFTVRARCLLELSGEDLPTSRDIASTIRTMVEHEIRKVSMKNILVNSEYVSLPVYDVRGEMLQGGGPPDSFDFTIKVWFAVKTTIPTRTLTLV